MRRPVSKCGLKSGTLPHSALTTRSAPAAGGRAELSGFTMATDLVSGLVSGLVSCLASGLVPGLVSDLVSDLISEPILPSTFAPGLESLVDFASGFAPNLSSLEVFASGLAPSSQSYLVMENIIKATKDTGADAIHPGYGFLAENSHFNEICRSCKIDFIGPTPEAMESLGDKNQARELARAAQVPVVPASAGKPSGIGPSVSRLPAGAPSRSSPRLCCWFNTVPRASAMRPSRFPASIRSVFWKRS